MLILTGAVAGAWVTLRQVRATRDQIEETATASRNQLKLSEQGQVTDRYTRAVEQLGHEKAPVQLGALYSLEHLAQDNPDYRQTVVDVFCAYLRMPYATPPRNKPTTEQVEEVAPSVDGPHRGPKSRAVQDPAHEELQVRQTAQRLLPGHWSVFRLVEGGAQQVAANVKGYDRALDRNLEEPEVTLEALNTGPVCRGDLPGHRRVRGGDLRARRQVRRGDLPGLRRVRAGDLLQRRQLRRGNLPRRRLVRPGDLPRRGRVRRGDLPQ